MPRKAAAAQPPRATTVNPTQVSVTAQRQRAPMGPRLKGVAARPPPVTTVSPTPPSTTEARRQPRLLMVLTLLTARPLFGPILMQFRHTIHSRLCRSLIRSNTIARSRLHRPAMVLSLTRHRPTVRNRPCRQLTVLSPLLRRWLVGRSQFLNGQRICDPGLPAYDRFRSADHLKRMRHSRLKTGLNSMIPVSRETTDLCKSGVS